MNEIFLLTLKSSKCVVELIELSVGLQLMENFQRSFQCHLISSFKEGDEQSLRVAKTLLSTVFWLESFRLSNLL